MRDYFHAFFDQKLLVVRGVGVCENVVLLLEELLNERLFLFHVLFGAVIDLNAVLLNDEFDNGHVLCLENGFA